MLKDECDLGDDDDDQYDSTDMNLVKQLIGLKINDGTEQEDIDSSTSEQDNKLSNILVSSNKVFDFSHPSSKVSPFFYHFFVEIL